MNTTKNKFIILASQSPRRIEILKNENILFVPFPVYVSEIPDKNLSLDEQIIDIARRKAEACLSTYTASTQNALLLSADTMVCLDNSPIGKPIDSDDAFLILKKLSGKTHFVKTALVIYDYDTQTWMSHIETTAIEFNELKDQDILDYIITGEPMDKAGAYAIQGLGSKFVKNYTGDFLNVVGLPKQALFKIFKNKQWSLLKTNN